MSNSRVREDGMHGLIPLSGQVSMVRRERYLTTETGGTECVST